MRHNDVRLYAIVASEPKIIKDDNGKEYAQVRVITINSERPDGRRIESKAFDFPALYTSEEKVIKVLHEVAKGDLIAVKGAITTEQTTRKPTCSHCGERNSFQGIVTFVSPIAIVISEKGAAIDSEGNFNNDLAIAALERYREISNSIRLVGVVCRDPQPFKTDVMGPAKMTSYQMAIKRSFRLTDSLEDEKCDFPWIKSYGREANKDSLYVQKGTYLLVDGWFRCRKINRKSICSACGKEFTWNTYSSEIVVYKDEPLKNIKEPDENTLKEVNKRREIIPNEDPEFFSQDILTDIEKQDAKNVLSEIKKSYSLPDNISGEKNETNSQPVAPISIKSLKENK